MTERDFWMFLEGALARGREVMLIGSVDSDNPLIQKIGEYHNGHSLLPKEYNLIPKGKIIEMGRLLLDRSVNISTKEAIMMLLAHHGSDEALNVLKVFNKNPDREVEVFARIALEECEMWNEG